MQKSSRNGSLITVDEQYDLPFAIAYGKLTWFLWTPLDAQHRRWKKINEQLELEQVERGCPVQILGSNKNTQDLKEILGLWYDYSKLLEDQPREIQALFELYPIRFPRADLHDFELLFAAAVLSPQVSWETNSLWTRLLFESFRNNLKAIANSEPEELDDILLDTMQRSHLYQHTKLRKLGYHSRVLIKAFQDYRDKIGGNPRQLYKMPSADAKAALLQIYGIGPKVAMFLVQATHGDLSAPCIDTHVFSIARSIGFMKLNMVPYNSNMCKQHIRECKHCPDNHRCGSYELARYQASSLVSALLYYLASIRKPN